jgi:hypothetical protein
MAVAILAQCPIPYAILFRRPRFHAVEEKQQQADSNASLGCGARKPRNSAVSASRNASAQERQQGCEAVADAFDFRIAGKDLINGAPVSIAEANRIPQPPAGLAGSGRH